MALELIKTYILLNIDFLTKILVTIGYGFFATLFSMPYVIRQLKRKGYAVQDKYKDNLKKVPVMGGIATFIGIMTALSLSVFFFDNGLLGKLFIFYFVVIVYFLYGILDDLFAFKARYDKILILIILSLPISVLISKTTVTLPLLNITLELGQWYPLLIAPVFVMVVANMINLHAGFNGLTTGLNLILFITITIKILMISNLGSLIYIAPALGGLCVLWTFNKYPAKVLPGNSGDLMAGAIIGGLLMVNNLFFFGLVILIPHIFNFIIDTWTIVIKKTPDQKFGRIRKDGTIEAPPTMRWKSIKFALTHYFRLTEKQAVEISHLITIVFCVIGVVFF